MRIYQHSDGYVVHGSCTDPEIQAFAREEIGQFSAIIADPPYGRIVSDEWDQVSDPDDVFVESMLAWVNDWKTLLCDGGAFYVWGGVGKPGFRPFFKFLHSAETMGRFELSNLITWSKRRAYGTQYNYLFTREELAYFVKGKANKPAIFNVPLLDVKRGYSGYNKKYPAKSEYKRRTNVWTDITEIMRNKLHVAQKPNKLHEIVLNVSTNVQDWVCDPFCGSGVTAVAARNTNRRFFVIDSDEDAIRITNSRLNKSPNKV